jgi:hypothetical protein
MTQKTDSIAASDIPDGALVRCPIAIVPFQLVSVKAACGECQHCAGLAARVTGPDVPFEQQYRLLCKALPIERDMLCLGEVKQ